MKSKLYLTFQNNKYPKLYCNVMILKFKLFQFISNFYLFPISIYFLLFPPLSLFSQSDSLKAYQSIAAKNNPLVLQKYREYEAALRKIPQIGSLPDPEITTGIFLSPMELVGGKQVADIRLMQMFPWFGVLKAAKDEMSLMAKARFESFRDVKLQLYYDVQRSYYELYKVKAQLKVSEKNLGLLKSLERLAVIKFQSATKGATVPLPANTNSSSGIPSGQMGSGNQGMNGNTNSNSPQNSSPMPVNTMNAASGSGLSQVYTIQIERGELENNLVMLQKRLITLDATFNILLNRPVQTPIIIPDTIQNIRPDIVTTLLTDTIISKNPMVGMLNFEQKAWNARKQMVTKMGYPMVGIGINYSLIKNNEMSTSAMNGKDMVMPMVTVTLPIYRKKYKAMQEEADLMKSAASQGIKAASNTLLTGYYEAIQNFEDAQRRVELFNRQHQLANQSFNILLKSFSASEAGLSELLRIQQQTFDYETKKIEAITDLNTAIARLDQLMANQD